MLKEQLLQEAQNIDASVALDSIFESVTLSDEAKATFSTVFEATVKAEAVKLAESHILTIAESADEKLEKAKEEADEKAEEKLSESVSKFLDHIAKEWLTENQVAVDRGIKADLFESMFAGMKELFVEHNVVIPEESVDVVAEMEEELAEQAAETAKLFESNTALQAEVSEMKRSNLIKESVLELTESQKEKVTTLVEGMGYSDSFGTKLTAIVEMVKATKETSEAPLNENVINNSEDASGLNYQTQIAENAETPAPTSMVDIYARAASRLK